VYEILTEPDGRTSSFFIAHQNGILFVTNDNDLINKNLESGLPKANQMTGVGKDMLVKYGNCQYWDSQKSFDAIINVGARHHPREQGKMRVLQKHLNAGTVYTVKNGDTIETQASLNFTDSSINSLTELVNLLYELDVVR
jgi:hypothetical protein